MERFCIIKWIEKWEKPRTIILVAQGHGNFLFQTPTYVMPNPSPGVTRVPVGPVGPAPHLLSHVYWFSVHWQHAHIDQDKRT